MKQTRTENTPRSAAFNINILDILYFVSEKSGIGISTALIVVFCAWAPLFMVSCGGTSSDAASSLPLSAEEKQRLEHRLKQLSHDSLVVISNDSTNRFDILHRMLASRLLGLSKRHVSEFSEAINHTRRYLSLAYAAADTLEAERALNDLGTNFRRIGALSEASNFHHTALYLTNLCSDKTSFTARKNRAISLNGLGNINLTLKYLDEAKYYFKQALEIERELKSSVGMAINYANLGAVFHEECLHDSAVLYYGLSMEQNRQGKSILGLSLCHNNLGEVYEKMGNLDSAQVEYQRAYDLMADDPDRWHALLPYLSLGRIALNRGQGATAYRLLSRAKAEAEKIDAPEQMEAACELLHRYYLSIGDYKQALKLIGESHTWGKRVISEQQLNRFMESRVSYEQEKNRSEIDKLNRINEMQARKKAMIQQTSLIAIVSLVVIASLLFVIARLQTKRNRELREVNATKDKLLSIISHDLKSPVVAQKAVLDTIIGNYHAYDTPALLHYLNLFRCTSESQMHLIQNLLAWTQMHAGKIKFKPIPFDIGVVLKDVVALYRVPCENKQLHIGVDSSSRSYVYADKEMIATVIRNLLNNAVKFSHRGGKIDIIVHSYEDKIYVCVRDYGLGMSLQQVESLRQENYYTSSIGTQGESGNGLGLIICKDFLIRNGSKLLIESRLGEGSELSFDLNKVSALLV